MFEQCIMCENDELNQRTIRDEEIYNSGIDSKVRESEIGVQKEQSKSTFQRLSFRSPQRSILSPLENSTGDWSRQDSKLQTTEYYCKYCTQYVKAPIILPCLQAIHHRCMIHMISVQLNQGDAMMKCICNLKLTHFIFKDESAMKNQLFSNQVKAISKTNNLGKCPNTHCDYVYMKDPNFKGQYICPICI